MTGPPHFESILQITYETILKDGDLAIDVGAHNGRHSLPIAKAVSPSGRVFAFEPLGACRELLATTASVEGLDDVTKLYPYALSDYEGESYFVVAKDALGYSGLRERTYDVPTRLERVPVSVRRIDDLFLSLPSLQYIKVDAGGGELHILKGAAMCIDRFRPFVTFEFGANSIGNYQITSEEIAAFWADNHYRIYDITGLHLPALGDFVQSAIAQKVWDYVAVPSENCVLNDSITTVLRSPNANGPSI